MLLILLAVTAPAEAAGHARMVAAASVRPAPPEAAATVPVRPDTPPDAPAIVPAQQPPDLSWDAVLRAGLPGFLASLGSGAVLAVTAWGLKRLASRRGEP
ncbi:hypothetical protein ACFH04_06410 [Streptomyces noboritoensis]|uniref:Uncharacterized protein n=1 Tax=Streptomyces noboritoensis TaxID=67337 RepID=A0ABV6TC58_9ACTN